MSRSGLSCPGCGSSNIVDDDLYCQAQLVCVDCGSVVSEGALTNESVYVGASDVSYSRTTAGDKKPCMNLLKGRHHVIAMCRILRVNREIEDLSQTFYSRAYQHKSFIRVTLRKKEFLAGCCVLVSCRMRQWPVTIGTISCLLDADLVEVGAVYKEMVTVLNIEAPSFNIYDVIEAHSQEYKISLHVAEELAENHKDLTKRAVELVELAADTWVVTGRQPVPVIMAAIYLSWQSLKPNRHRLKLSLDKFCQLAKVKKQKPAAIRVTEMKEVEDILKHRYALLRRALRAREEALLPESLASCEASPPRAPEVSDPNPAESPVERRKRSAEGTLAPGDEAGQPRVAGELAGELAGGALESPDKGSNWGARALFAPPCVVHAKRRRVEQPELRDVTGDEEISDSEIDSYIRTPREAREFAQMQNMFLE
uniref:Transcription factor IIIB 50 kDa subunit n=1 Tax=Gasterosteus aculeatus aculeatus TaxID=481459 RepID=A0AAQ4QXB1_GASAC